MKTNKKYDKSYTLAIKQLIISSNTRGKQNIINSKINVNELMFYYLQNIKKSSKKAQILPSVLFFVFSLVCFSCVFYSKKLSNFWVHFNNENIKIMLIFIGILFTIFSVVLLLQRFVFGIKIVYISDGYNKGYRNITKQKHNEIINILISLINEKREV